MKLRIRFLCVLGGSVVSLQAAPPNILLIVSEENDPELGCFGDPHRRTPNLDRPTGEAAAAK
jgi:N-sulfoglucosamine sulfohydrolase